MSALVLSAMIWLVPLAVAQTDARSTDKVTEGVRAMAARAARGERVTVIVKMKARSDLAAVEGEPVQALSALRQTASVSQGALLQVLRTRTSAGKVGLVRPFWIDNVVLVQATADVIEEIARRDDVARVFENYVYTLPEFPQKLEAQPTSPVQPWDNIAHIGAKRVWSELGLNGHGVRIGGLDTGVDITHPDIAGKMVTNDPSDATYPGGWAEFDLLGERVPGSQPHDTDQHGTHTSGTMVGGTASGYDVGVAPGARLMHGLILVGGSGTFAQIIAGMEWIIDPDGNPATDDGAQVVNMSLGAGGVWDVLVAPTDNMVAAGIFPSMAIGNAGPAPGTTGCPGNVPSAFAAGATDDHDDIADFSSRGPVTWNTPPYVGTFIKPDISAPGVEILSTVPGGGWQWSGWDGTSMASPHVAGTVALMLQANPGLTVATLKQLLVTTAIDYGTPGKDNNWGYGRLDAYAAVAAAVRGVGEITGTVTNNLGEAVAAVRVKDLVTGLTAVTDTDGRYGMQLTPGRRQILFEEYGHKSATLNTIISANRVVPGDIVLTRLPGGEVAGVVSNAETGEPLKAAVQVMVGTKVVKETVSDAATGAYSLWLPAGAQRIRVVAGYPYEIFTGTVDVIVDGLVTFDAVVAPASVLIVDDDQGDDFERYYEVAVVATGRRYLTVDRVISPEDMLKFDSVVWLTGNDYQQTLTSLEQAVLSAYLDNGGHLLISGQDIEWGTYASPFYADYLHAEFVVDDSRLRGIRGDADSPVGGGFEFLIRGGDGANNQGYPAEINPIAPAKPVFWYDEQVPALNTETPLDPGRAAPLEATSVRGTAGLSVDTGVYRLVYLPFGFEGIADGDSRNLVMDRILGWLEGYPTIAHEPLPDTEQTDSPYLVRAAVTSENSTIDAGTVTLVYDTGNGPVTVAMNPAGAGDVFQGWIPAQPRESVVHYYLAAGDVKRHIATEPSGAPRVQHSFKVGEDHEAPAIAHKPILDTNDRVGPHVVTASVTDNVGVSQVFLVYRRNGGALHRVRMQVDAGRWEGSIPGPFAFGDSVQYFILAADASVLGNATRYPAAGELSYGVIESFAWNFETNDGGFFTPGVVWQWGTPSSGPGGAHSGNRVWGTALAGDYPNGMNAVLDFPAITLEADKKYSVLSFWHWYEFETLIDGGNVKVSTDDGATWSVVEPLRGYDGIAQESARGVAGEPVFTGYDNRLWQQEIFDLSAYAGETVWVRLHAGANDFVTRDGWYIDDVNVRSIDMDDIAPEILSLSGPPGTFDTAGPYPVSAEVIDALSGVAVVALHYSTDDGVTWSEEPMAGTGGTGYRGYIPGLPRGSRVLVHVRAQDADGNQTDSNASGQYHRFNVMPSAPVLVLLSDTEGATEEMFREGLDKTGRAADYWNLLQQGPAVLDHLDAYSQLIVDERGSMTAAEVTAYQGYLDAGTETQPRGLLVLGRDVALSASSRNLAAQYLRADFVQDDPGYRRLTGVADDPIGIGEVLVISGAFPDEVSRSLQYPGGQIVYQFTGEVTLTDGVTPNRPYLTDAAIGGNDAPEVPKSPDAAAGIRYDAGTYRSVFLTFNYDYIVDASQRDGLMGRVMAWFEAPRIVHTPLRDTENAVSGYEVIARVYSDDPGAVQVQLTYDTGGVPVTVNMTPTGNESEFAASIPAQPLGTVVSYFISAQKSDGNTAYDPPNAPDVRHTFRVERDTEAPRIVHVPIESSADVVGPYHVSATITDNIAVETGSVTLTYRRNGGAESPLPMTNTGGDQYEGDIPGPASAGDRFDYFITARDRAETPNVARAPVAGTYSFEIMDFFAWDFEMDNGGYRATGAGWEHGAPSTGPGDAHSGANVWATRLADNYPGAASITLDAPSLRVPDGATYAQLSYWQWYSIEPNYDGGNVKISNNGGATWSILTPVGGYPGTARAGNRGIPNEPCFTGYNAALWQRVVFDLTPYRGQTVVIRWHFGSDPSVQKAGWYIDDVRVEGTNDIQAPAIVSVKAPYGVTGDAAGYLVEATIADAHSGVGSAQLEYTVDEGENWQVVPMKAEATGRFAGRIPGQLPGARIQYVVQATDGAANRTQHERTSAEMFTVVPGGDYLLIVGGETPLSRKDYREAFSDTGREVDLWRADDTGLPSADVLGAYRAVIVDWYGPTSGDVQRVIDSNNVVFFGYQPEAVPQLASAFVAARAMLDDTGKDFDPRDVMLAPGDKVEFAKRTDVGRAQALYPVNIANLASAPQRAELVNDGLKFIEGTPASSAAVALPRALDMSPNYPNPFNPVTTLKISVPAGAPLRATLNVYDVGGRLVRRMFSGGITPGVHAFVWNGRNDAGSPVASGIYFARFEAGATVVNRKMALLK
ncbi:MAG: S8 family serine peptidase [Candidatus Krumholzibacteria bacterium]|nr:S8 family serine peptidase [Candidatus Krumholzibacteria bacterium]MDH4335686.1 S8 family serine peptidase [Candidatus Krumholzibacteria bacterium]MDH5270031.1 S8 family serine peptidase [Candidatus Krumholzibacteria bacterium]